MHLIHQDSLSRSLSLYVKKQTVDFQLFVDILSFSAEHAGEILDLSIFSCNCVFNISVSTWITVLKVFCVKEEPYFKRNLTYCSPQTAGV